MRLFVLCAGVVGFVFGVGCGRAASTSRRVFKPADDAAIRSVLAAQRDAWNRGDLDGYMAGYLRSKALVFTSGARIRRGWESTLASYRDRYGDKPATMGTLSFEVIDVHPLGADGAVVLGRWRLTNSPSAARGVFTVVLERRPEGWRVVHDHTSVDRDAAASVKRESR